FVLGVKNALPAREHLVDVLLGELRREVPKATWTAAGIGRYQSQAMEWALARGAEGVRTGLEDNVRITRDRLAGSNAELVEIAIAANTRPRTMNANFIFYLLGSRARAHEPRQNAAPAATGDRLNRRDRSCAPRGWRGSPPGCRRR